MAIPLFLALDYGAGELERAFDLLRAFERARAPVSIKVHSIWDILGASETERRLLHVCPSMQDLFIDLKLSDTPGTMTDRTEVVASSGAKYLTVHVDAGPDSMKAAVAVGDPTIIAITVLTSMSREQCIRIFGKMPEKKVVDFALDAYACGIRYLVCSALEVGLLDKLRQLPADDPNTLRGMKFIVPGTRSAGVALGQQKRSTTPRQAVLDGADYLVIGSEVRNAANPVATWLDIQARVNQAEIDRRAA